MITGMVGSGNLPAVCLYDRLADGKSDSHPSVAVTGAGRNLSAFKNMRQKILGKSTAVIPD